MLDAIPASRLGFLPDTGHLAWAGVGRRRVRQGLRRADPVRAREGLPAQRRRSRAARGDWGYQQTVLAGLWVEPGRGELDLNGIIGNLPSTFDGWLMVEVDRPDIADPYESASRVGALDARRVRRLTLSRARRTARSGSSRRG